MNLKKINSPKVIDTQMRLPDASSFTYRKRLGANVQYSPTDHVITNVEDPSLTPNFYSKQRVVYKGSGTGGHVPDASQYIQSLGARSIAQDNFTRGRILVSQCTVRPPASQVVNESGNADGDINGLNMGYLSACRAPFNPYSNTLTAPAFLPQSKSYFVDTIPDIKLHKIGHRLSDDIPGGLQDAQNAIHCTTTNTSGPTQDKDEPARMLFSEPPVKTDFVTAPLGDQVGGGNTPGSRAPKVGGALRKIPVTNKGHGSVTYNPYVPYQRVPPNGSPAQLKINDPNHYKV